MIPDKFTYLAPTSLPEVWQALQAHPDEAKILAGGQSLIPLMKFRLATPAYVVDLRKVAGLDVLEERDGALVIGAMVRESALERSDVVRRRYTGAYEASSVVADPIVRNFATVGGNLAHADPANDHPAMMLALRARWRRRVPTGSASIRIDDFLVDTFETALGAGRSADRDPHPCRRPDTPARPTSSSSARSATTPSRRSARRSPSTATSCTQAGIGLTNVGPKAIRATQAEAFLVGKRMTTENVQRGGAAGGGGGAAELRPARSSGVQAQDRARADSAGASARRRDRALAGGVQ